MTDRDQLRLPTLGEPSRLRARCVDWTFAVVLGGLGLLVVGWGWGLHSLRVDVEIPVTGRVVAVDEAAGVTRVELVVVGEAPRPPRAGDPLWLRQLDGPTRRLDGEIVRADGGRIEAVLRHRDETWRPKLGARVEGRWIAGTRSGIDWLRRGNSTGL